MRLFTLCERCDRAIELWGPIWYHARNDPADHAASPKVPLLDHIPKGFGTVPYWPAPRRSDV